MKKLTALILVLAFIAPLSGCAIQRRMERNEKMKGWEYVRIEKEVPQKNCVYKIQVACGEKGAQCYNYYKRQAKIYDANVAVITEDKRSWQQRGSEMSGQWKGDEIITALADLYYCPDYKYGEQK